VILRGQVHWVEFGGPRGRRPAVVVSHDRANAGHTVIIVAPITNTVPATLYPSVLCFSDLIDPGPITGCARFDALQAVPRTNVEENPAHILHGNDMNDVNRCLRDAIGL
jgi:mRNA-degrading endonuclease toxin of MazEF toxin-antitoxin module